MKIVIFISLSIGLCAAYPSAKICRQLADGVVPEDADEEDVNECYECDWRRLNLSPPGENAPPGMSGGGVRCQSSSDPSIRIPLGRLIKVGGIDISGDGDRAWITDFTITYIDYSGNEESIKDESGNMVFVGNTDASTTVKKNFLMPVEASELRIKSNSHNIEACARIGVFACNDEEKDEIEGAGMGQDPPMPNADGDQKSFDFMSLREWIRFLFCNTVIVRDCFGKCAMYKKNVFGCDTCECRKAMAHEKYEGDILATEETTMALEEAMGIGQNQRGASSRARRWSKQGNFYIVPYETTFTKGSKALNAIKQAIADFNRLTCIRLAPRSGQRSYIRFISSSGCFSPVGRQTNGNTVSIGDGCERKGIVIHEILHSLGFWHEQSRPDRDNYVQINFDNIARGRQNNFQKRTTSQINSFGSPYDTGSLMHYGGYAFSSNRKPTIVLKGTTTPVRGQRTGLAATDIDQINKMYPCNGNPSPTTTTTTSTTNPTGCRDRFARCNRVSTVRYPCSSVIMRYWCRAFCRIC